MKKLIYTIALFLFAQLSFGQTIKVGNGGGTSGSGSNYIKLTFNTQTSDYTLALPDSVKEVIMNVAATNTLTVPLNSVVAIPIGSAITIFQYGAGQTTISPSVGVTLRSTGARYKLYEQYSSAILTKISTDEWLLVGDLNF